MRVLTAVVVAACGSGSNGAGTASESASAPIAQPPCLKFGKWHGLERVRVDDKHVVVCTADRTCASRRPICAAFALATGKVAPVAPPAEEPPPPALLHVKRSAASLELCGAVDRKCNALPFKATGIAVVDHELHVAVSRDGKVAAIAGEELGAMHLVEVATTKQIARVVGEDRDGNCLVEPYFLGDVIYARSCSHSFPMHTDALFRSDGTRIGVVHGVAIAPGDRPLHIAGTHWAVLLDEGDGYLVFDAATGARVRTVPARPKHSRGGDDDAFERRGPLRTPSGKLVVIGRDIVVSDPASGAIEQSWPVAYCPPSASNVKPSCP